MRRTSCSCSGGSDDELSNLAKSSDCSPVSKGHLGHLLATDSSRCRQHRRSKIDSLRSTIAAKFGDESAWRNSITLHAFLRQCQTRYLCCDYEAYFLGPEFLDGIIHVANAIKFVQSSVSIGTEHVGVLESLTVFWRRWRSEIEHNGLRVPMIAAWLEMMKRFDGTTTYCNGLAGKPPAGIIVDGAPALDLVLNSLLNIGSSGPASELSDIFTEWRMPRRSSSHAATVLDFLIRVRMKSHSLDIYSDEDVVRAACARETWTRLVPVAAPYCDKHFDRTTLPKIVEVLEQQC
jgi:hypothetical protein